MSRAAFLSASLAVFCLVGCGTITVVPADAVAVKPDVAVTDLISSDVPGEVSATADAGPDTIGLSCSDDKACAVLKGKTPCKQASCVAGFCKLVLLAVDAPCEDPNNILAPGLCAETRCTLDGQCTQRDKKNGSQCGSNPCGKKCDATSGVSLCVAATPGDYEDGDPCTTDYCDQNKVVVHAPLTDLTIECDDGNKCTTGDTCTGGKCLGQAKPCSDGIDCTFDTCDALSDCVYTPNPAKCDDGNPCTKDGCDAAKGCVVDGPDDSKTCDDGNACTINDACKEGSCQGASNCACNVDADCAKDDNACTGKHICNPQKVCIVDPATIPTCEPSTNACLKNICDVAKGGCTATPVADSTPCDDGDICTTASYCTAGVCKGAATDPCDDANPCTTDACAAPGGCTHVPSAQPCDDKSLCTSNDVCVAGGCKGAQVSCDDNVPCSFDSCDEASGKCLHTANNTQCEDNNPCTLDVCDVVAGCTHPADDNGSCTDKNDCTADKCSSGKCVSVVTCDCQSATDCNDGNPCTTDSCVANKCVATPASGMGCTSADKCMQAGTGLCNAGKCMGGSPIDCSMVGDACNAGTCNAQTGVCETVAKALGTACDADSNGCTQGDYCAGGKCNPGGVPNCAAPVGAQCVVGGCQSTSATAYKCTTTPMTAGTPCNDSKPCTTGDVCSSTGTCAGPTLLPLGTACEDGQFCTEGETCDKAGLCVGAKAKVCSGPNCTAPYCDEVAKSCFATPIAGCCMTAAVCDDGNSCTGDVCKFPATSGIGSCQYTFKGSTCCDPTIWSNDFESFLHGMTLVNSASPALGWQLRLKSPQVKSGGGVLYYGNPVVNNFVFNGQANNGQATTPLIAVPAAKEATLNAWVFIDTELPAAYDALTIRVLTPDGKSTDLWKKPDLATPPATGFPAKAWFPLNLPLKAFAGMNVQFVFDFNTLDNVNNFGMGVFLDDISVTSTCP